MIDELVQDLETGQLRRLYQAPERPDLARTPVPRWDLIDFRDYVTMLVQFSRGCPYDCEFCDIVIMNGRVPRTKSPAQMLAELDALHAAWLARHGLPRGRQLHRQQGPREGVSGRIGALAGTHGIANGVLHRGVGEPGGRCGVVEPDGAGRLQTRVSGDRDPDPFQPRRVPQTSEPRRDLAESVRTIQRAGLEVMGGFIVGFDNDPPDVFERQFEFIQTNGRSSRRWSDC